MKLGDLNLLEETSELDRLRELLAEVNATAREYPRDSTVHAEFSRVATLCPSAIAIVNGTETHTYGELDACSNRLARMLRERGVGAEDLVAVLLQDTWRAAVVLLGVLKAGGAYLPLDSDAPVARLSGLLYESGARFLVCEPGFADLAGELRMHCPHVDSIACPEDADFGGSSDALPEYSGPTQLAYVIYTSGTTGRPKGSAVEHRAILRLACNSTFCPFNAQTSLLRIGALSFDASTLEFWCTLLNGGRLCHAPAKAVLETQVLKGLFESYGVNTMFITSALFNRLVDDDPSVFAGLRYLMTGGERASVRHFASVRWYHPSLTLIHCCGPTENTVYTTTCVVEDTEGAELPIGRPISNTQVYICDGADLAPLNTPGELCAGGDGVARCYWNNPRLTAERFTPHPEGNGERLYRSGDLARMREDGNIEFIGRVDDQVKIRGFRVELGEIELCMERYPGIVQAVVAAAEEGIYGKELTAWFTSAGGVEIEALRGHMAATLPEYMIPSDFVAMERFPLTKNGKVDRRALPKPEREAERGVPPEGETEQRLMELWERVLERPIPGTASDFFELGGHSLKVALLVSIVRQEMGVDLPLMAVFETPTIWDLARVLISAAKFGIAGADEAMVRLNTAGAPVNVFAFPPGRGDALGYSGLARALDGSATLFGFNFIPRERRLAEYADAIMAEQQEGPYMLFGYSAGGRLAYHVAAELERRGRRVSTVTMADSSRYLARMPVSQDEVDEVVTQFVNADDIRPYLGTGILRDKAVRQIRAYYDYAYCTVDSWVIDADIHLIASEGGMTSFRDESGKLLASNDAWAEATRGRFVTHRGSGSHNDMLNAPWLDANAELLKRIVRGRAAGA
jgi:amino acid adenylation domain-containing protein